ncbi:MAG: choice-of-anchor D domain-containing protein [Candidatus Kapabacteria bacterium]|jgi:hypothetical protein|nr:choice-of-anchor D domain-containing protein [Candidatus Kapabacteria bacterium]
MIKKITLIVLTSILILSSRAYSQPEVSYIIPDIGAPSMNVYVEFISPHSLKDNFGQDGFYLNNTGDAVRVIPQNSSDESKVKIGPVVVSWEGRLISTQIFVNPTLEPDSYDALTLSQGFRIPLVVVVNGVSSQAQMFYIVKPRPYFDGVVQTDTTFGEGGLGRRSPRGAMIFDSIKLGNKIYTVSTNDCDPNTDGNQGYLPFVLLSKGKVEGAGAESSIISVSSTNSNGGPGGGGGGGRFFDGTGSIGDNGGDGFVGGGAGGRNNAGIPFVTNEFRNHGSGSGLNGISLNGVPYPKNEAYESAGGGTGHPFGSSGTSCNNGNNCSTDGEFGGGSGVNQVRQGGSGGYGTDGDGFGNSGGKSHGNIMNIPLAGGSGGASGNPQGLGVYSGSGGGGGGAISLFASEISGIKINAHGADGYNFSGTHVNTERSPEPFGGSGSGGTINLLSKGKISTDVTLNVDGGFKNNRYGGKGRIRIDWISDDINIETNYGNATFSKGISTDTSKYVKTFFSLTGTQKVTGMNENPVRLYISTFGSEWTELPNTLIPDANGNWQTDIDVSDDEPYYCLVAVQDWNNNNTDNYGSEPSKILSQAAANLLILDLNPILIADDEAENPAITCIGYERIIETVIKNDKAAGGNLEFNLSNSNWIFGNNGFEIVEPLGDISLSPGDSVLVKVKFQWSGGDKVNISNRLFFNHNDPAKANPWLITFKVGDAFLAGMDFIGVDEDFIFPDTRIGGKNTKTFVLKNLGDAPLRIESINDIPPPFFVTGTDKSLPTVILPSEELRIYVEFRPTDETDYLEDFSVISIVTDTTCASFAFRRLSGKGVVSSVDVSTSEIDFGLVPWCDEAQQIISIRNPDSATISFTLTSNAEIVGDNPEAFEITNPKNPPITITPGDGTQFNIRLSGKEAGTGIKTALFRINTDVPEIPVIEVVLKAEIIGFNVVPSPTPVIIGDLEIGFDAEASINLRNDSRLPAKMLSVSSNNPASTSLPDVTGAVIAPNGGIYDLDFIFNSSNQPIGTEIIIAFDEPCPDTLIIPVNVNYIEARERVLSGSQVFFNDTTVTDTLDFGKFSPCQEGLLKLIEFGNLSQGRYIVLNESIINLDDERFFAVGSGLSYPDTIHPGPNTKGGLQIYFDPDENDKGIYYAEYSTRLYLNGKVVNRKLILKAEVVEGRFDAYPFNSDFSAVLGLSDDGILTIKNSGPYNIRIIDVDGPNNDVFVMTPEIVGLDIASGSELEINISFTPVSVDKYRDTIIVSFEIGACIKVVEFILEGNGTPSKILTIYIPDIIADPADNNVKIPIYAKLDKADDLLREFMIESIEVRLRRSMYYPRDIEGGELIESSLVDDYRLIKFKIDNILVSSNDSLIAEIDGAAMLGDTDFTNIEILNVEYSQKVLVSQVNTINGSLQSTICAEGGDRLLRQIGSGSRIEVNPNPAGDVINIKIHTIEKGLHTVEVIDLLGNVYKITDFMNDDSGDNGSEISYSSDRLSTGKYILKMQTPSEIFTTQFIIVK